MTRLKFDLGTHSLGDLSIFSLADIGQLTVTSKSSVVPRSRFQGDTSVPIPEFQRDICKFWGTHRIHLIFTCKIEKRFLKFLFIFI